MSNVQVKIDRRAIVRYLASDGGMQSQLRAVATALEAAGQQLSPVGKSTTRGGYFKRHWYIRKYRDYYRVGNNDAFVHLVEFGSRNNPTYAPTRSAMAYLAASSPNIKVTYRPKADDNE